MIAASRPALAHLDVTEVSKAYHGIPALRSVSLTIEPGEVHALVGENGAGKSTLIKIISGVVAQDTGTVRLGDATIAPGEVTSARHAGIATIHQESTVFPDLNAIDNIFVGRADADVGSNTKPRKRRWLLDPRRRRTETIAALAALGEEIDVDRPLSELPLAVRQMVAIARALSQQSKILILDEPTASLSAPECDTLFRAMRTLRERGIGMLYVSHRLAEVFALADRITVLRDGQVVEHGATSAYTHDSLIRSMVGRDIAPNGHGGIDRDTARASIKLSAAPAPLTVTALTREPAFREVSLTVRAGEVVGLAGLVGAGRSEVARAIFGMDRYTSGRVTVDGTPLAPGSVQRAVAAGIALVPEDRQQCGLVLPMSVRENLLLAVMRRLAKHGFRSTDAEQTLVQRLIAALAVRTATPDLPVDALSGGNQQKVVVGKWLATNPRVLILDEPTRGVDVGAKAELYAQIRTLANDGMATLLISSDLPEILALSDRILVMREGSIAGELSRAEATEERILALAVPSDRPVMATTAHGATTHQVTGVQ